MSHGQTIVSNQNVLIGDRMALGPYVPDGTRGNYGFYDAVNYNTNRAARPFFAVDSRYTLTSWSRLRALSLARWSYINVPFVRGAIDLMARLSVGTGFTAHSLAKDTGWGKAADAYVADKMRNIGFAFGESMDELLMHDCRCVDVDGDFGYVMVEDENGEAKLQTVESHRIKNGDVVDPRCRDGVWLDNYGRKFAYNVMLPGDDVKTRRIPIQNFIYLAERNRPDETRSMTNLIHALAPLQDLYEVLGFEMQSVKKNSEIGLTIETPTPNSPPLGNRVDLFQSNGVPANGNQPAQAKQVLSYEQVWGSGGKIPILLPGEKLTAHSHLRPAPGMVDWSEFTIRGVAVGLGLPFEILWNPEAIGGANTRMITGLTAKRIEQRRGMLNKLKLNRVRFWLLSRAIKRRELPFNRDITKVEWNPNFSDLTVDAGRDSRERRANVLSGLDTFTGYFAENGSSYESQLGVRESEIGLQCEAAMRLVEKYPGLSFEAAMARIAMLTQNAAEATVGDNKPDPQPAAKSRK